MLKAPGDLSSDRLYHVYSAGREPTCLSRAASEAARDTWVCSYCLRPLDGSPLVPVELEVRPPRGLSLQVLCAIGRGLIRDDLLRALDPFLMDAPLELEHVRVEDEGPLPEWHVFRGRVEVPLHGAEDQVRKRCPKCEYQGWFPARPRYVRREDWPGEPVCESSFSQLLVTAEVLQVLLAKTWKGLNCEPIPFQ